MKFFYTHRSVTCSAIIQETAANEINSEIHSQIICREQETLEYSVLNGMLRSKTSPEDLGKT